MHQLKMVERHFAKMRDSDEHNGPEAKSSSSPATEQAPVDFEADSLSKAEIAKLTRKIDRRVLPVLFVIYVVAFLDRSNISNALTMGMPTELGLTGRQPDVALAAFFIPYILFEMPSNMLLRRLTPRVWLAACMLGFGAVTLGHAFARGYAGLVAARALLGLLEAGVLPGSLYLISFWYARDAGAQARFAAYYCSVILAAAFGGLLASGVGRLDGVRGLSGWRWLFVLEGALSVLVAVAAFFLVSDFPADAAWLSDRERRFVLARTAGQRDEAATRVTARGLVDFLKDPKNYLGAIINFSVVEPIYAFSYFTPTIIKTLGYGTIQTQLHSVPPFAAALGTCLVLAYLSDRSRYRMPYALFASALLVAGLAVLLATTSSHFAAQYAGICLVCMGAFSGPATVLCWYLMNLRGHERRAIGSAFVVGLGNTGGIIAPFTFPAADSPRYRTGYAVCMASALMGLVGNVCYGLLVLRERRRVRVEHGQVDESLLPCL